MSDTPGMGCAGEGARFAALLPWMMGFLPRSGLVQQFIQAEAASRLGLIQALDGETCVSQF